MAFDERLAQRIRTSLGSRMGTTEKHMFGGLAFMLHGKMFCGIVGEDLMVRVGPETYSQCLALSHVRPMDFTGKPMTGYVFVAPPGRRTAKALERWIERGLEYAGSLTRARSRKPPEPPAADRSTGTASRANSLPPASHARNCG